LRMKSRSRKSAEIPPEFASGVTGHTERYSEDDVVGEESLSMENVGGLLNLGDSESSEALDTDVPKSASAVLLDVDRLLGSLDAERHEHQQQSGPSETRPLVTRTKSTDDDDALFDEAVVDGMSPYHYHYHCHCHCHCHHWLPLNMRVSLIASPPPSPPFNRKPVLLGY